MIGVLAAGTLLMPVTPAFAASSDDAVVDITSSSAVVQSIEAAAPAVAESAATVEQVGSSADSVTFQSDKVEVTLPTELSDGIAVDAMSGYTVRVEPLVVAQEGQVDEAGIVTYEASEVSVFAAADGDGGVSIGTVIPTSDAPTRYEYRVSTGSGTQLELNPDGTVNVLDTEGRYAATIDSPWAIAADGSAIPTWYEVQGDIVVQVVAHDSSTEFPVVADPAVRGQLISAAGLVGNPLGVTIAVYPQPYSIYTPGDAFYEEYKLWVSTTYQGQKYRDQLVCHVVNARGKTPWNIDSWRPNVGYAATVAALCNP